MKQPVTYELAGIPVTGLTPTATVERSSTGLLVDNVTVTESLVTSGLYYVNFTGVDQEQYVVKINAGTDSVDNRIQWFSTVAIDHLGGSKGGVIERSVTDKQVEARLNSLERAFDKKLDKLIEQFAETIYALPEMVVKMIPQQEDIKPFVQDTIRGAIDSIPKVEFEIDIDTPTKRIEDSLLGMKEGIDQKEEYMKVFMETVKEELKKVDRKSDSAQKSLETTLEKFDSIVKALDKFGEELTNDVIESVVDFWTALEVRKQEASEKINMKEIAKATFKDFNEFKSKK